MEINKLSESKDQGSIPRVAVEWKLEGHRKRGRPRMTWRRTVEALMAIIDIGMVRSTMEETR